MIRMVIIRSCLSDAMSRPQIGSSVSGTSHLAKVDALQQHIVNPSQETFGSFLPYGHGCRGAPLILRRDWLRNGNGALACRHIEYLVNWNQAWSISVRFDLHRVFSPILFGQAS
jgi:hypothetical protein